MGAKWYYSADAECYSNESTECHFSENVVSF